MPLSVTHIILTIIAVDLVRDYFLKDHKRYFTLHTILIAGIGGILPDIDIPINWFFNFIGYSFDFLRHRGATHTLFFALIFIIPAVILLKKEKHKQSMNFFVLSFGILFHLLLDFVIGGGAREGAMWLWPISNHLYTLDLIGRFDLSALPAALDAIILLLWLWHEEAKHKIKDFI